MEMQTSHDESEGTRTRDLQNAAQMRATLTAYFSRHRDVSKTVADMMDDPETKPTIDQLGYKKENVALHMRTLADNDVLSYYSDKGANHYYNPKGGVRPPGMVKRGPYKKVSKEVVVQRAGAQQPQPMQQAQAFPYPEAAGVDVVINGVMVTVTKGTQVIISKDQQSGRHQLIIL